MRIFEPLLNTKIINNIFINYLLCIFLLYTQNTYAQQVTEHSHKKNIGITLGLHASTYEYDYKLLLDEISATNSEWVSLTFKFYQDNIKSNYIEIPDTSSAYWKRIDKTIKQAKQNELKVLLLPIVLLRNAAKKEWRGKLKPADKAEWFDSYCELMQQIAIIAETNDVDMLSIGSEFSSLEDEIDSWTYILNTVKESFTGEITYSVNWDSIEDLSFIDQIDLLGISGYFSLTNKDDPTEAELYKKWIAIRDSLKVIQQKIEKPIFFSELGYTSQNGTNKDPWNYFISSEVDLQEQVDCYSAFTKAWINEDWLAGVFFYDWFGEGGNCDLGYTMRKKPVLKILSQWFPNKSENK